MEKRRRKKTMNAENLKIAKTIALQLGELGLYGIAKVTNQMTKENGIVFEVKGNKNYKKVAITLNGNDLYDVVLVNWKGSDVTTYKAETQKDVFVEDLMLALGF